MDMRRLKQILKALANNTRLRIVNVLLEKELTVKDICSILGINQPTVSKHLMRLRLLRIVYDRREGNHSYYRINEDSDQGKIVFFLFNEFSEIKTFIRDTDKKSRVIEA